MIGNGIFVIIIIIALAIQYGFVEYYEDKILFKLFEQRDKLALYAMSKPEMQRDEHYIYLRSIINREIMVLKYRIRITEVVRASNEITEEEKKAKDELLNEMKKNIVFKQIFEDCEILFEQGFKRKHKLYYILLILYRGITKIKRINFKMVRKMINKIEIHPVEIPSMFSFYAKY